MNPETARKSFLDLKSYRSNPHDRSCDHPNCGESGQFRAPKSPDRLTDHYWFCLDHVRAYNAAWDYFKNKSTSDISRFQRDVAGWHRPTWKLGSLGGHRRDPNLVDPFDIMSGMAARPQSRNFSDSKDQPLTREDRDALDVLELDGMATKEDIKKAYKALVKRYHPDACGGDRTSEDKFRALTAAYQHLASAWR